MKTLVVIILFVIIIGLNGISDAKQLKLVFAIFRHGDRTPVATYPTDPLILVSQETMINWCITMGLLLATKKCPICDNEMIIVKQLSYRCHQKHGQPHDYRLSALNNTWFSGSKFSIENIIILTYLFSVGTTKYEDIKRETSDLTKTTSHNTISDWLNFCREVVFDWVEKYQSVDLLGGEGVVVEIDETKVGKRKYNRGRLVDGTWILGLVEIQIGANCRRGGRFRLEICPLNKRDADTLLPLIRKHVKIGTTIVSDCWAGYYRLTDNGFVHFTVNHSKEFVNSHTGANTQTIESQWRAMKRNLLRGGIPQDNLYLHLAEYLWRRHSGKQRMYSLGKYMRKRYKSFLGQSIREVWIRSSQRDRCLNSALLVMAGLYPPTGRWKWGRDLGNVWQPVPVNTVEFAKDSMLNPDSDCPVAKREEYIISKSKDVQNLFKKHKRLVNYIATKTGLKFKDHGTGRDLYNNLQIVQTHNHMLPNWTNSEVMECLKEFHEMSFLFDSSTQLIRKLRAGQLLKDIRYRLKQFIARKEKFKHKLFIYSTHDTQLSVFLRSLDIYNNMSPPYGSTIFIELYDLQTKTSKKKSVFELEVHYLNDTKSEKPYELPVKMCQKANKTICELNNFFSVTKNLIVNNWEQECQESYLSSIFKFEL